MKCDPTYINNSTHVNKTFTGASLLMAANNDNGSVNVHIIGSFNSAGTAGFSIPFLNASMIPSGAFLNSTANGDLAHEIGHVLGLQHTHQYSSWNWKCLTECVSRTRTWPAFNLCPTRLISNRVCEATGDGLRDTQADDNLISNRECFYNVNFGNDEWGDSYDNPPAGLQERPNVNNIMSYNSATNCVEQISRLQIAVMLWTLYFKKTNNISGWANPISTFDNFEPDNEPITARNIQVNQVQERNFHQQWNRAGGYGYTTQCDVDWVRFTPLCNSNFTITTSAIVNRANANTRLTLFDNNLVQLAQNDDISSTNLFSNITFNFIAGNTYFIRVENIGSLATTYYSLAISPTLSSSITGNATLCSSPTIYSIQNLPPNTTAAWSVSPSIITAIVNPPNGSSATLNSNGYNGNATITATLTNGCGTTAISKQIFVGEPFQITNIQTTYTMFKCNVIKYIFTVIGAQGSTNYKWYYRNITQGTGFTLFKNSSANFANSPVNDGSCDQVEIRVDATNECSATPKQYLFPSDLCPPFVDGSCSSGRTLYVSPNPSVSNIELKLIDEPNVIPANPNPKKIMTIRIVDKMGQIKRTMNGNQMDRMIINLSNLSPDIYTILVFDGREWMSKQINRN